ncbi:protein NO VEIN domain-containing protein [Streptomyces sp. NBC_01435]|uniref:protein NO VEIN domain-containing protein n=1 Tax=Streptomyces sp. NBC_01435 TaxID=2903865 RepID=UPI003FCD499F
MGRPVVEVDGDELRDAGAASAISPAQWSRATEEARRAVGAAGEKELLRLLRRSCVPQVRHVAAESDAYGYDIAAGYSTERVHLEVKSTTDPTRLVVHLTRHEYEVMATDADWHMVAVLVGKDGSAVSVATVGRAWLHSAVPADQDEAGRWESVRLEVPAHAITPGFGTKTWQLVEDWPVVSRTVWAFQPSVPRPLERERQNVVCD